VTLLEASVETRIDQDAGGIGPELCELGFPRWEPSDSLDGLIPVIRIRIRIRIRIELLTRVKTFLSAHGAKLVPGLLAAAPEHVRFEGDTSSGTEAETMDFCLSFVVY
jgi:hypothetical protein